MAFNDTVQNDPGPLPTATAALHGGRAAVESQISLAGPALLCVRVCAGAFAAS